MENYAWANVRGTTIIYRSAHILYHQYDVSPRSLIIHSRQISILQRMQNRFINCWIFSSIAEKIQQLLKKVSSC
jgi:hypothetical protein